MNGSRGFGRPVLVDEVVADDALVDMLASAPLYENIDVEDGADGELARVIMAWRRQLAGPEGARFADPFAWPEARSDRRRVR